MNTTVAVKRLKERSDRAAKAFVPFSLSPDKKNFYGPIPGTKQQYFRRVTNFLDIVAKPALVPWAAKRERELVVRAAEHAYATTMNENVTPMAFTERLKTGVGKEKAHQRELEAAQTLGTHIHKVVESLSEKMMGRSVTIPPIETMAQRAIEEWEKWAVGVNLEPIITEVQLHHENESAEMSYAGTTDCIARVTIPDSEGKARPRLAIIDYKSSSDIYSGAHYQLAAYRFAANETKAFVEEFGTIDTGIVVLLPKRPGVGFKTWTQDREQFYRDFATFRQIQYLFNAEQEKKNG